jgi:hypothetical protein
VAYENGSIKNNIAAAMAGGGGYSGWQPAAIMKISMAAMWRIKAYVRNQPAEISIEVMAMKILMAENRRNKAKL